MEKLEDINYERREKGLTDVILKDDWTFEAKPKKVKKIVTKGIA